MEVASAPAADSPACRQAAGKWPRDIAGMVATTTTSSSPSVRAWGDPAVIARCGVAAVQPTTADCVAVDDVDWVIEPLTDGIRATTYGRAPAIEVLIPSRYSPGTLLLPAFAEAARSLPTNGHHCR
jgi:hypothetical protein